MIIKINKLKNNIKMFIQACIRLSIFYKSLYLILKFIILFILYTRSFFFILVVNFYYKANYYILNFFLIANVS